MKNTNSNFKKLNKLFENNYALVRSNKIVNTPPFFIECDEESLPQLIDCFVPLFLPGDWIFLEGDMGTGKTSLAKLISEKFSLNSNLTSPTFSILSKYKLEQIIQGIEFILHLDLYRIKNGREICYIGLEQEFNRQNSIALFEWAEILEQQDWINFFQTTNCSKPNFILNIHITPSDNGRKYEFYFLNNLS